MTVSVAADHGIWLVRHAPTEWTGRRWCGRADPPLTRDGYRLALSLAVRLASILPDDTIIRSSPARRAVGTAEPIAARVHSPIEIDPDLAEVDVGRAEGWTWDELAAREPETAGAILTGRVDWPDGETAIEVERRAVAVANRIATTSRTRSIVVVSHGRFLSELAGALGASIGRDGLAPCGVIRIAA